MQSALKRRISERLTDLFNVLQYLHNGKFVSSNLGLRKMSKDILVKTIVRLLNQSETEKENVQPEQDLNDQTQQSNQTRDGGSRGWWRSWFLSERAIQFLVDYQTHEC